MNIDTSKFRKFQDFFWNNLSICSNNYDIRIDFFQNLQKFRVISHFLRLIYRNIVHNGFFFYRCWQ